jgi:NADPH:quinone reductase-like Zn-dependent oxidoreductase
MNAAVVRAFGVPPRYGSFAEPVAGEGEGLVNVTAAALHRSVRALADDTQYASAGQLPFIPGVDGVGRLADGTRVFFGVARSPFGSFAERTVARHAICLRVPDSLDDATLAAIANPAMSAWAALTLRARFTAGESVLILGATGVAGKLAVQIAKRLGARRVIAAGRNTKALEEPTGLGADAVISLGQRQETLVASFRDELRDGGVDVVLDYLWGSPAEAALEAISQTGLQFPVSRTRFVQIGSSAGATIMLAAATLRSSGLELFGSGLGSVSIEQIMQEVSKFFGEAGRAPFQINIRTASLCDVEALWTRSEAGTRLVFRP